LVGSGADVMLCQVVTKLVNKVRDRAKIDFT
jgi:hypothetical protein